MFNDYTEEEILRDKVKDLENEVKELCIERNKLKRELDIRNVEYNELSNEADYLEEELDDLKGENNYLSSKVDFYKRELNELEELEDFMLESDMSIIELKYIEHARDAYEKAYKKEVNRVRGENLELREEVESLDRIVKKLITKLLEVM